MFYTAYKCNNLSNWARPSKFRVSDHRDLRMLRHFRSFEGHERVSQLTYRNSSFDRPQKQGFPALQSYLKRNIFWPSWGGPQEGPSGRLFWETPRGKETYAFYNTFACPTIETYVFFDTFASPTIETYIFYGTFASPTIETYSFTTRSYVRR